MTDGRVVGGRYRLELLLGQGGMGRVWKARDETLDRVVAVKELMLPDGLPDDALAERNARMLREAKAAARVEHPNLVTVYDVLLEAERPWIVMEYIDGPSLETAAPLTPQETARIGLHVLDAMCAAHEQGVVHRDIKPGNILIAKTSRVVLTDFGIASIEGDLSLTRSGTLIGSPGYIAPEVLRGDPAGPGSDLWSLAATLYTAVEGRAPFTRSTLVATLTAVLHDPVPPTEHAGPLAGLLTRLLDKSPDARPDIGTVRSDLERVSSRPHPAPDPVPAETTLDERPAPRSPLRWTDVSPATTSLPTHTPRLRSQVLIGACVGALAILLWVLPSVRDDTEPTFPDRSPLIADPTPTLSEPSPTPTPERFCSVLTLQQVRRLIPNAKLTEDEEEDCAWAAKNRRGLTLRLLINKDADYAPTHEIFKDWRANAVRQARACGGGALIWGDAGIDEIKSVSCTAPEKITGIGDEAYLVTTYYERPVEDVEVMVRIGAYILEVNALADRSAGTARQTALSASRSMAKEFKNRI